MELWEYNMFMQGCENRRKYDTADCILTGYYAAYYMNGGKKTRNPNDLIGQMFHRKQSYEDGLREIERIKKLEQGGHRSGG